ncbi:MAG: type I-E CRISPR-associated protein Cse2/CasB [Thermoguttaceae bacterium]|nr:type I-E CRISPR-associated protein Cse2/CasB [Thermoguttaceae bacterium]
MTEETDKPSPKDFVIDVITRIKKDDTAFRAALTLADNPQTEYLSWRYLIELGSVDLKIDWQRRAYALVGAAIARKRPTEDGSQSLGEALKMCCIKPGEVDDSVDRRFRRILACDSREELITVLRQIIRYLQSNEKVSLKYEDLLWDILKFGDDVKRKWAKAFYPKKSEMSEDDSDGSEEEEET